MKMKRQSNVFKKQIRFLEKEETTSEIKDFAALYVSKENYMMNFYENGFSFQNFLKSLKEVGIYSFMLRYEKII